ncbi:hypothetical protein SCAB_82991 [Streptomyces scabiei 87.22]|uniref:Uncharacterized protein n=1 Tax=Streptomyces scabiei (strain 87.22) TaxID=680198 RepID=C9YWZ7_STRSW|nr:hypothetical protein SCAB_82991 [Streptomyces scabiei 87.22]
MTRRKSGDVQALMIAAEGASYTCGHRISSIRVIVTGAENGG